MEADLLRFYNVDVLDFYRGHLTGRRLQILIQHLPTESALVRLHGPEIAAKAQAAARHQRVAELKARFAKLKRRYATQT